ncbi:MAG: phosphonate ABC transporter ATP-binding protein [Acutalibacter sp.]
MEALLRFDNVSKQYPNGVHALNGVSFTVGEGEFISVIGPSGSGKSTLLRAINRLIPISGGAVLLEGEAVSQQRGRALRRKVGMIFQNYNLVYSLSVLQNVLHGRLGYMRGPKGIFGLYSEADKRQALELLEELGLGEFSYNRASDLSGGQKQRVGIARAILQGPKLLLCDEPIASLTLQLQNHHGPAALHDPEAEHRLHCQPAPAGCGPAVFHPDHRPEQGGDCL